MTDWSHLEEALHRQKDFSDKFFDPSKLTDAQKEEILKTFVLSLHSEVTGICEGVNYKDHRRDVGPVDLQKILFKSIDAYRYLLAILNLWNIDSLTFSSALQQKDDFLHYRHNLKDKVWSGQPVVLFDLDDVLAEFRASFSKFVTERSGVFVDPQSNEYYNASVFKANGLNSEQYFKSFVDSHGFLGLDLNAKYHTLLQRLRAAGCWIQVITARPDKNSTCFYDTYSWLARHGIPADGVAFSPEKFVWLSNQSFYHSAAVVAVDDSAKHAAEYVKHGVPTIVPKKPYNSEVSELKDVLYVQEDHDPFDDIIKIIQKLKTL